MHNIYDENFKKILSFTHGAHLVSLKIASHLLGLSLQTVYNRIYRGRGEFQFHIIKNGTRSFIRINDLAEFLTYGKVTQKADVGQRDLSVFTSPKPMVKRGRRPDSPEVKAAKAHAKHKQNASAQGGCYA
ncbi:hypothetical protein ACO0K0_03915 [Undibacterium sp. SXout11W]|uniref:hypothetical protein n=1 Tax=Undibacterium sp. SXout11W TaxID=3413050 RepID=UPI003BF3274B